MRFALALLLTVSAYSPGAMAQAPAPASSNAPSEPDRARLEVERMRKTLSDWPNLGRYSADNAKVVAPTRGEDRVVFMGDSITDNWGRRAGKFFPDKPYVNRGIGGQTTNQMLVRFRADVIALQPKAVVILAGTNDIGNPNYSLEATKNNLTSMAELARANKIQVVLATVMPVDDYHQPQTQRRPPEKILELNNWIKQYAAKEKLVLLDYFTPMVDEKGWLKTELSGDGLHPNDAGYALIEPLAEKAIAQALRK